MSTTQTTANPQAADPALVGRYRQILLERNPTEAEVEEVQRIASTLGRSIEQIKADARAVKAQADQLLKAVQPPPPDHELAERELQLATSALNDARERQRQALANFNVSAIAKDRRSNARAFVLQLERDNPHLWPPGQRVADVVGAAWAEEDAADQQGAS